jgi:transcriptional regulator of acetoin/glycerol metabolism
MIDEQPIKLLPTPMSEPTVVDSVAGDPVDDCCKYLLSKGTKWEDMQEIVKSRYLKHVVEMAGKKSEAAKWLGIGPTYICKLLKQHNGGS